jgi:hypothetical protein
MGRGRERVRGRESKGSKKCGRTGESEPAHPSLSPLIPSSIPHLQSCTSHSAHSVLYFPSCTCFPHLPFRTFYPTSAIPCTPILHPTAYTLHTISHTAPPNPHNSSHDSHPAIHILHLPYCTSHPYLTSCLSPSCRIYATPTSNPAYPILHLPPLAPEGAVGV